MTGWMGAFKKDGVNVKGKFVKAATKLDKNHNENIVDKR